MGEWQRWQDNTPPSSSGFIENGIFFLLWQLIKLPFRIIAAPFIIFSKVSAAKSRKRLEKWREEERAREEAETKAAIEDEQRRRTAAYVSLPVVDRMTATIKTEGNIVRLQVALSEEERGIIAQNRLGDIIIESEPLFRNEKDIERALDARERELLAEPDPDFRQRQLEFFNRKQLTAEYKSWKNETPLAYYLDPIFTASFDTPHEANSYAKKLESKILPKIVKLIDTNRETNNSKTIRL